MDPTFTGRPDYDTSHENRADMVRGSLFTLLPLAVSAVSLRFYSRIRYTYVGVDDYLSLSALVFFIALVVANYYGTTFGMGKHLWDIPPQNAVQMEKTGFASEIVYAPGTGLVKISILLFLTRVLPAVHGAKLYLRIFAGIIAASQTAFFFALVFQCTPVWGFWERAMPNRKCVNQTAMYFSDAGLNIAYDIVILIIPSLLFRKLNVPRKQRYGVIALCSVGIFTLISGAMRFPALIDTNQAADPPWHCVWIAIWTVAELGSAITLSCIPTMKPIYVDIRERIQRRRSQGADSESASAPSDGSPHPAADKERKNEFRHIDMELHTTRRASQSTITLQQGEGLEKNV